jgi:3-oxoacyl-[acyl-carrier-protein] synthase II
MEGRRIEMREVWITEAVTVTPLGEDLKQLWQALLCGNSAIKAISRFPVQNYHAGIASCIDDLFISGNRSMAHALLQRLVQQFSPIPNDTLLITATTKSGIDNLEKSQRGIPAEHRDIMISAVYEDLHRMLKLEREGMNISASCASSTIAIAQGAELIVYGWTDAVLVCCMDLVTEFVFSGFSALQALSPEPCRPFDRDRRGLSIGEGAAALLLMSKKRARQEKRPHLATILGWGAANDASHITAPAIDGCGLQQAIKQAIAMAKCKPSDIAAINAHGTGTIYNDLMELKVFNNIFADHRVPVYSIKGAIGHTMGAAGGIEAAVGILTLQENIAPPTTGFANPEKEAEGRVQAESIPISGDYLLTTNSGFGGINAAIILGKGSMQ